MKYFSKVFIVMSCFFALQSFSQDFESENNDEESVEVEFSDKVTLVEEQYIPIKYNRNYSDAIPAYKKRRSKWGFLFGLGISLFTPENYQPNFSPGFDFAGLYGDSFAGLYDLTGSVKLNLDFGSLMMGLGVGYYTINSLDGAADDTSLTVIPVRAEFSFLFDTLMAEPKYVPYVLGGAYTNFYTEKQASTSFNGNTSLSYYFGAGINFQLDWLDPQAGVNSYLDYGIENTFLYVEGRTFISSSTVADPDFETTLQIALGAKFEY